jgi:hypothetical protein
MMSRQLLERIDFKLWSNNAKRGLDNNSLFGLKRIGVSYTKVPPMEFPGVIDVKSGENIWGFNYFLGEPYSKSELFKRLSEQEIDMLTSYVTESAEA